MTMIPPDSPIRGRIQEAGVPVPARTADPGELVAKFLCEVLPGKYTSAGEFVMSLRIPSDIFEPHDLMAGAGQGQLMYVEIRMV